METKRKFEIDMCHGPLLGKILLFSLPLMASGVLQLLFNAADMVVVGRWGNSDALAAVGSTGSLINLLVNVFLGLSVGTNVLTARYFGSKQDKELSDMVHTAILTAAICGVFLIFVGFFIAPFALTWMGAPTEVLSKSVLYIRIYFAAMPAMMLYNFGAAILRAVGDTRRPLVYLFISGIVNVILNLIFVIGFQMSVAGVGLATAISQVVSAYLVLRCLLKSDAAYGLKINKLRINTHKMTAMLKIGLPAGLQGALFAISNVLIQASINSFGTVAIAGNSAAANLEGFVYMAMNTLHQTAISFVGQNYGNHYFKRIRRTAVLCLIIVSVVGIVFGNIMYFLSPVLLRAYVNKEDVAADMAIAYGVRRLLFVCCPYFLCGVMDTLVGCIRGMGRSVLPMIVSLTGACVFRIIWIHTIFAQNRSLDVLYVSYPISWFLTSLVHAICFVIVFSLEKKRFGQNET